MSLSNIRIFAQKTTVNCRIGSLEKMYVSISSTCSVNCRIGSLEMASRPGREPDGVNCRIGSLEMQAVVDLNFVDS